MRSKTRLIDHCKKALGASVLFGNIMAIDKAAATKLVAPYFPYNQYMATMVKDAKNVDFLTTGRQPSGQDFARISEWIKQD